MASVAFASIRSFTSNRNFTFLLIQQFRDVANMSWGKNVEQNSYVQNIQPSFVALSLIFVEGKRELFKRVFLVSFSAAALPLLTRG